MSMERILEYLRPLIIKVGTRAVLWLLVGVIGMETMEATEPAQKLATGLGAVGVALAAFFLDKYHDKKDKAEKPNK
jgi:hypothetical protein